MSHPLLGGGSAGSSRRNSSCNILCTLLLATKTVANGNFAPAYRAIRTSRYLYVLYANGQTELYDIKRDPAQLNSLALDPRYRYVRKWLFDQLAVLSACVGASSRVEIGPDPSPLPKSAVRPKRKKKPRPGTNQPTAIRLRGD